MVLQGASGLGLSPEDWVGVCSLTLSCDGVKTEDQMPHIPQGNDASGTVWRKQNIKEVKPKASVLPHSLFLFPS